MFRKWDWRIQQDFTRPMFMYFIESNISINILHPTYIDRETCRCSGVRPVWFDA